jgi:hypothetical protein
MESLALHGPVVHRTGDGRTVALTMKKPLGMLLLALAGPQPRTRLCAWQAGQPESTLRNLPEAEFWRLEAAVAVPIGTPGRLSANTPAASRSEARSFWTRFTAP